MKTDINGSWSGAMNTGEGQLNRKDFLIWGALLILYIPILMFGLTHEGVWYDEACSLGTIRHPLWEIWDVVRLDVHPPLYFYMLKLFSLLFGDSLFALRTFSVIGLLAVFSLGIGLVRRACGKTVGLLFSFMVIVTPIYLGIGRDVRMYAWAIFFVTGSVLYAYLAMKEDKRSDWIKFGLFALAAMYTHYYGLLAMMVLCGLILIRFLTVARDKFNRLFLIIVGVLIIAYLPWVINFTNQLQVTASGNYWIPLISKTTIREVMVYPFGYKFLNYDPYAIIGFRLAVGLIFWGFAVALYKNQKMAAVPLAIGVYGLTLLGGVAFSYFFWPILHSRHLLPVSGLLLLGTAYGMKQLPHKLLIPAFALIFAGLMVPHIITINQREFNGPIKAAVGYLQENIKPEDVIITTEEVTWGVFCYYFPDHQQLYYVEQKNADYGNCKTFKPNGTAGVDLRGFIQDKHPQTIWVIDPHTTGPNRAMNFFSEKSVLEKKLFKLPHCWFAVRIYKIKPD